MVAAIWALIFVHIFVLNEKLFYFILIQDTTTKTTNSLHVYSLFWINKNPIFREHICL